MKSLFLLFLFSGVGWAETYNDGGFDVTETTRTIEFSFKPPTRLVFGNPPASLSWETGELVFDGENIHESAKVFFEFLKPYVDEYIAYELGRTRKGEKGERNER